MADPITKVYILDVPLENDYKNTLYFANASAQQSYFQSRVIRSFTDFTYQRKDQIIRLPVEYDSIYHANYVMYQNSNYSNKWFYAFITELEYINDGLTYAHIETDVIQTWLFDYNVKSSFVEREHTADDTIGSNTVPENLELGEYVVNGLYKDTSLNDFVYILHASEVSSGQTTDSDRHVNLGGVEAPGVMYVFTNDVAGKSSLVNVLQDYDNNGKGDAIISVYMVPRPIIEMPDPNSIRYHGQDDPKYYSIEFDKPDDLDSYEPRNKKLFTYPFCYLILDNNNGTSNILQYEEFKHNNDGKVHFEVSGVPVLGGSIKCIPKYYKNMGANEQEGIICGKFPVCGWVSDLYINWLTQNAVNIGVGIASSGLSIIGGIAAIGSGAGAVAGASMVGSGALGIASSVGQIYQHKLTPDSARGNTNGGDIATCYNANTFYFVGMSIKEEYAQIIDGYFDLYGYKTNRVKIPNKNHRQRWWYTKTINVNIDGNIPQNDMQRIKNCYDNGITFWRNASEIENYSLSNNII